MTASRAAKGWIRRHALALSLGAGAVVSHAAAIGFFAQHDPYGETIFPPCILLSTVGIQCPGCGGTRAMYSLLQGDVAASLAMNPLVIAGYLALVIALIGVVVGRHGASKLAQNLYWLASAVAIGATLWSAVIRNIIT